MKAQDSSALQTKESFLNENRSITESSKLFTDSCKIGPDDEVWLLQCPRTIDIDAIIGRKIKLPGKSRHEHIESVAEQFSNNEILTLGTHSSHGYKIKNIPISGEVCIRTREDIHSLEEMPRDPEPDLSIQTDRSAIFKGLKVRHPLLGADYKDKTEMKPSIAERLKEASRVSKHKKKKRNVDSFSDTLNSPLNKNPQNVDGGDYLPVKVKKEKTTKRHTEETPVEGSPRKYKKLKKEDDTDDSDLQWIKQC